MSRSDPATSPSSSLSNKLSSPLVIIFLCIGFQLHAQPETSIASENWFDRTVGIENSGLINGPRYKMEFLGASSNPFFSTGELPGTINIDGRNYSATLLYDIYKNEIIVKHINKSGHGWFIELDRNSVKEFTITGRLFTNFRGVFHEVLFRSAGLLVVAKRSKLRRVKGNIQNYIENNEYFLVSKNNWTRLWGDSSFKKLLRTKEEKEKLKQFLSVNKIKVRKHRDEELVKVAGFIDGLLNNAGI